MSSNYQKASFLLSAATVKQLPPDQGIEVAIVGRSNAGKSSVLNRITQNKSLARVSKTPGRTQLLNIFQLDEQRRLVDLPGYGYAKVHASTKQKWQAAVDDYLSQRHCLRGLLLIMDIRHPFKPNDFQLLEYCAHYALDVHIVLNKSDKIGRGAINETMKQAKVALTSFNNSVSFQSLSAAKGTGIDDLYQVLNKWYEY